MLVDDAAASAVVAVPDSAADWPQRTLNADVPRLPHAPVFEPHRMLLLLTRPLPNTDSAENARAVLRPPFFEPHRMLSPKTALLLQTAGPQSVSAGDPAVPHRVT